MPYIWQAMIAKKRLWLGHLRDYKELTQAQVAAKLGVSRQAVTAWETGHQSPEREKMLLLADLLGQEVIDGFATEARENNPSLDLGPEAA